MGSRNTVDGDGDNVGCEVIWLVEVSLYGVFLVGARVAGMG